MLYDIQQKTPENLHQANAKAAGEATQMQMLQHKFKKKSPHICKSHKVTKQMENNYQSKQKAFLVQCIQSIIQKLAITTTLYDIYQVNITHIQICDVHGRVMVSLWSSNVGMNVHQVYSITCSSFIIHH